LSVATPEKPLLPDHARHDVRMDGVFFFRTAVDGPFVKALEPGEVSYCVMVRSGHLRLETDFPRAPEIALGPGDAVSVSGLAPHAFRSAPPPHARGTGRFERLPPAEAPLGHWARPPGR
jgi:hypothetical protein